MLLILKIQTNEFISLQTYPKIFCNIDMKAFLKEFLYKEKDATTLFQVYGRLCSSFFFSLFLSQRRYPNIQLTKVEQ